MSKLLSGRVAVVAGATRGAGRGIARMLGEAGATVCCTGRSSRAQSNTSNHPSAGRPETIEETATDINGTHPDHAVLAAAIEQAKSTYLAPLMEAARFTEVDWKLAAKTEHPS